MEKLFNPQSIALIGASRHKEKLGYQILENLVKSGYQGKIFPINPKAKEIIQLKAFGNVNDVPEKIDLVVIIVPAAIVPEVLSDCAKKQIPYAVVISSGFAEMGQKGQLLQEKILDVIKASPLRVIGPNCLGIINTDKNLNLTFSAPRLVKGNVSAVFQSGALGVALLDWAEKYEFGFAKFISLGNKVDIEESEVISFLADDPETKVIALYLEEIENLAKFLEVCRIVATKKPIILLKGGTTHLGARAAFSHTAALVNPFHITEAILAQSNIVVAQTIEEMLNLIQVLSWEPPARSSNTAIVTNAGGPGILAADAVARTKLNLPAFDKKTVGQLKKIFPRVASIANPLDLSGEAKAQDYANAISYFLKNPKISSITVLLTPQSATEITKTAEVLAKNTNASKAIIASFLGDRTVSDAVEILRRYHVPYFDTPESAIKALAQVTKYWEKFFAPKDIIEVEPGNLENIPLGDPLELLARYNIPIPPSGVATNIDVVMKIIGRIGMPVVVKNVSGKVIHKYKAGKVILNVQSESFLKFAVQKVGYPVLIQRMVDSPFEIFIGAKRDKNLGIILTFGWGGIFVEDLGDICVRILPLTELDLDEMIKGTKIGTILIREHVDLSPIKNILVEVSQIMAELDEITELDLNPVKITQTEAICVDARFKLGEL